MIVTATPHRSINRAGTNRTLRRSEARRSLSTNSAPGGKGATESWAIAAAIQRGSAAVALPGLDVPPTEDLRDVNVLVDSSIFLTHRLGL